MVYLRLTVIENQPTYSLVPRPGYKASPHTANLYVLKIYKPHIRTLNILKMSLEYI